MYVADNEEGIGIARVTGHTPWQYDDAYWYELL